MARSSASPSDAVRRVLPWAVPVLILLGWEVASKSGWLSTRTS